MAVCSRTLVVGGGLGGLAVAIRLRLQGREVTLLERLPRVGGRCGAWEAEGFRFDTGPSLLMMVEPLRELFSVAGARLEDYLTLVPLSPHYRVHFADREVLTLDRDLDRLAAEFERFEPGAGRRLAGFLAESGELYRTAMADFVGRNSVRWGALLEPRKLGLFARDRVLAPWIRVLGRHFRDERLCQALALPALYLGLNPFEAPGVYALLNHAELVGGLFFPRGGMAALPDALARLALELGVQLRCSAPVAALRREGNRVSGVVLEDGSELEADQVVVNADLPYAYRALLGEPHPRQRRFTYSCSTFLMYLGTRRAYPQLSHHGFFLPADGPAAMAELFAGRLSAEPLIYLCNANKTDPSLAPPGAENLFVLVPVPHAGAGIDWAVEGPRLRDRTLARLEARGLTGLSGELAVERCVTPEDLRGGLRLEWGAAFGLSHRLDHMGPLRPRNRHARYGNLYFVGASTHPGNGIPLVLLSGQLVAERMAREHPVPCRKVTR